MSEAPRIVEGQPRGRGPRNNRRGSRYWPANTTDAAAYTGKAPLLQFGEHGELTPKTIKQAGLTGEEKKRAQEMLKVQAAYLEIYQSLDYPTDPDGHVVDLSGMHMTQPKIAIAWTLALLGFRSTGRAYIKKRGFSAPGVAEGAYTWVDSRAADHAVAELAPQHRSGDHHLPPDTRRLAAIRDGDPGQRLADPWSVTPLLTMDGAVIQEGSGCPEMDTEETP